VEQCASIGIAKTTGGPLMSVVPVNLSDRFGKSALHRVPVTVTQLPGGGVRPWFIVSDI